jgi:hypothetical protein
MLTKLDVDDKQGHTLSLPLQDSSAGYTVKSIEGLDPVKATITSSQFAQLDGSQQQSARRETRNVIVTIGIEPYSGGSTVRALRTALYAYFMPKAFLIFKFYEDNVLTATIEGQVESCEAPLFSKDPELKVSVLCFDPAFQAPSATVVNGNTVSSSTEQTINYPGTLEVGYEFQLNVNRAINAGSGFTIYNRRPGGSIAQLDVICPVSLASGDVVKISTKARAKTATLVKSGGATSSYMYAVSGQSSWGPLYPGNNYFRVYCSGAAIPFTVTYTASYGGL